MNNQRLFDLAVRGLPPARTPAANPPRTLASPAARDRRGRLEPVLATLEEITERLRRAVADGLDLGCAVKLDLKGEGLVRIAGGEVSNQDGPAELTVRVSRRDLAALAKGELDPTRAMMTGRLKLSDMGLAMKLQPQIQALFAGAG